MSKRNSGPKDRGIYIAALSITPAGEHWETSLRVLANEAVRKVLIEADGLRPQALYVANAFAPIMSRQTQLGALVADFTGLRGVEAVTIEAAGASGGMAMRQAYLGLASGLFDTALVVGVEKITDKIGPAQLSALASSADADHEAVHGITPAAQAALLMRRYLHEHNAPADALAGFSVTAHANAVTNPNAIFRRALKASAYARAAMISEPLSIMDAAPSADGAAALLLARGDVLPPDSEHPHVQVVGSAASTTTLAIHDQPDLMVLSAASQSVHAAYAQSGLTPGDIDLFELHDQFTIYSALSLEAAGFADVGRGWTLAQDGAIKLDGQIPITTFGGSKARGDPGGATGVYQLAEVALQLQGRAGENQVADAKVGMAQCLGGAGATACTHILKRINP
jgi:acetyl-CoA C-acetyltransferase